MINIIKLYFSGMDQSIDCWLLLFNLSEFCVSIFSLSLNLKY